MASVYGHLAVLDRTQGRLADAEQHYRLSIYLYRQILPPGHLRTASALISYGTMLLERGAPLLAEPLIREGLASREAGLRGDSRLVADARLALAACLILLHRAAEAETGSVQLTAP